MFPDFIPIELRGMSILTALTFFFYTVGFGYFYSVMKREFRHMDQKIKKHDDRLDAGQTDMAEMKTNIALTLQTVTRMERILEKRGKEY